MEKGNRVGAVVRVSGSIPGLGVISVLSLFILYSALRGFSPVFSPLLKNQHLIWFELGCFTVFPINRAPVLN